MRSTPWQDAKKLYWLKCCNKLGCFYQTLQAQFTTILENNNMAMKNTLAYYTNPSKLACNFQIRLPKFDMY